MEHGLFKPKSLEEGKHTVVGDCNGFKAQERWDIETPDFARAILSHLPKDIKHPLILDYGCGVGRLAKEIFKQRPGVSIIGVDASKDELSMARKYVSGDDSYGDDSVKIGNNGLFVTAMPDELPLLIGDGGAVDLAYSVYVLQHAPAIGLRDDIRRIKTAMKDDAAFCYCSSDYRMAIRFDQGSFFDDRCLGVDIKAEVAKEFDMTGPLFCGEMDVLTHSMITGKTAAGKEGIAHPAFVYKKKSAYETTLKHRKIGDQVPEKTKPDQGVHKLNLVNSLSPGDILVMSAAVRALKRVKPNWEITVESPCPEIWLNNPFCRPKLKDLEVGTETIRMHYTDAIQESGQGGHHFTDGHRLFLQKELGIAIPRDGMLPEIYLDQNEQNWPSPLIEHSDWDGPYWCINAGSKGDFPLKQYPIERFQEFVDIFIDSPIGKKVKLVQIGDLAHNHVALDGTIDMRGKTNNHRDLFRLIYKSHGVISCVSYPMHIAAAFKMPAVIIAGGREGPRWEMYPNHRYLHVTGALNCAPFDGCWKSKQADCMNWLEEKNMAKCMSLITPEDIFNSVALYYEGGMLSYTEELAVTS